MSIFTISCSNNKVVNNHGFSNLENKSNKIEVSKSNINDVLKDLVESYRINKI